MGRIIRCALSVLLIYLSISIVQIASGQTSGKSDSLLFLLEKTEADTSRVRLLYQLSDYCISYDINLGLNYMQQALNLAELTGDPDVIATTVKNMARISFRAGLIDLSAEYYDRYLNMISEKGSKMEISYTLFNLGTFKLMFNDLDKAEELFLSSYRNIQEYCAENNDSIPPTVIINLNNNLGIIYREKGKPDESERYLNIGIKSARMDASYKADLVRLLINLGETRISQGKPDEAAIALNEALILCIKGNYKATETVVHLSFGNLSEKKGDIKNAFKNYRKAYIIAKKVGDFSTLQAIAERLGNLYTKTGQADSALKYLSLYNEFEKKLNLKNANDKIVRQELEKQFREREKELVDTNKTKNIHMFLIVGGLILLVLISFLFILKKLRKIQADKTSIKLKAEELEEINETKDKLFSIIAHDLRGPIGNFIPALEILTSDSTMDENLRKSLLEELKKDSKNTYGLLEDLLTWSRIQGNKIQNNPRSFVLNTALTDIVELLTPNANQKSIRIHIDPADQFTVFADKETVSAVVRNLLSNAIKFTPANGIITISTRRLDPFAEVTVADNGVGIEREIADNLFTSNSYFTTYGTNGEKGSGLGLVISREFVEKNGGKIRLESEPGRGSKFIFTIPLEINI